jgi:heme exporter protein B
LSAFATLTLRDLRRAYRGGSTALMITFFLLVATLYPFAVGPDAAILSRTGGGLLWVATLLAAVLPITRVVADDLEGGMIDQMTVNQISEEQIILAKMAAHWLSFGPPLMIAVLPASALLKLPSKALFDVELGLLIATPGLAALTVLIASITSAARAGPALGGLLLFPLTVPLLIFGAGSLNEPNGGALKLLAACSLLALAVAPFAGGAALRAARE